MMRFIREEYGKTSAELRGLLYFVRFRAHEHHNPSALTDQDDQGAQTALIPNLLASLTVGTIRKQCQRQLVL